MLNAVDNSDAWVHSVPSGEEFILFFADPTEYETKSKNINKSDLIIEFYGINNSSITHQLTVLFSEI